MITIEERLSDISHPASHLKNLPSHLRLVKNKEKKNLIWGYSNSAKRVYRDRIHNSTRGQALQKGLNPTMEKKLPRVVRDSIIARIRYLCSTYILCNLQELVLVDQHAYQLKVARKERLNWVDKTIRVVKF